LQETILGETYPCGHNKVISKDCPQCEENLIATNRKIFQKVSDLADRKIAEFEAQIQTDLENFPKMPTCKVWIREIEYYKTLKLEIQTFGSPLSSFWRNYFPLKE
jgi:hypothetical protein